ncbi:MAG: hypothetical protein ACR2O7_01370 [Parasphingorhabdus sp.]
MLAVSLAIFSAPANAGIIVVCVGADITNNNSRTDSHYQIQSVLERDLVEDIRKSGQSREDYADDMLTDACNITRSRSDEIGYVRKSTDYADKGYYSIIRRDYIGGWNRNMIKIGMGFGPSPSAAWRAAMSELDRRSGSRRVMYPTHEKIESGRF